MDGLHFESFRRKLEGESVFGMASDIDAKAAASVFIGLTILLVLLELGFSKMEHWAEHHSCKELFEKLKKELTMMVRYLCAVSVSNPISFYLSFSLPLINTQYSF
jgi:hypothetical protein